MTQTLGSTEELPDHWRSSGWTTTDVICFVAYGICVDGGVYSIVKVFVELEKAFHRVPREER